MLTVSISLVEFRIGLSSPLLPLSILLPHATFLHLAIIAVFILVETPLELCLSLPLHVPDPILVDQRFYFALCFGVVRNSSFPSGPLHVFLVISLILFYLNQLLLIYLLLIHMLLVILRISFYFSMILHER